MLVHIPIYVHVFLTQLEVTGMDAFCLFNPFYYGTRTLRFDIHLHVCKVKLKGKALFDTAVQYVVCFSFGKEK